MRKLAFLVIIMSTIIMFWQIHKYPIRFGINEGPCGLTALKVIEGDQAERAKLLDRKLETQRAHVGTSTTCRYNPALIYPSILLIETFGIDKNYVVLRTTSILYGILSVWLLYLFVGRYFNRESGLIAAFILATASWFIGFTRLWHDYSATICFSLLCCYFYSLSDKPRNPLGFIVLGSLMSVSGFFYFPARSVIPLFLFVILLRVIFERGYFKTHLTGIIFMIFSFILVLQLQGIKIHQLFALNHSSCEWFWVRYDFHPHDCATPWEYLVSIFKFAYRRFFVQWGWYQDPVCERDACLGPITRYLLILGVIWSLIKIKDHKYRFLLIWFAVGAAPTLITQTWFRRSILAIPAIAALSAVGIYRTFSLLFSRVKQERVKRIILFVLVVPLLIWIATVNLNHYFGLYENPGFTRTLRIERDRRAKFLELLPKYTVYTDLFMSEYGWPQSGWFEAKRLKREDYYKPGSADASQRNFEKAVGPAALYLKGGLLKIKEAGEK